MSPPPSFLLPSSFPPTPFPAVPADHERPTEDCAGGAIDVAQCEANRAIDLAEAVFQHRIHDACVLVFGEGC